MKKGIISCMAAMLLCASASFAQDTFTKDGTTYGQDVADAGRTEDIQARHNAIGRGDMQASAPFGISLFTPVQFPPESWDVEGIRLNILWGRHYSTTVADIGLIANLNDGNMTGIQLAGLANYVVCHLQGLQFAALLNKCDGDLEGMQVGCFNVNSHDGFAYVVQAGLFNISGETSGIQLGVFNKAKTMDGLQVGLLNFSGSLDGVQIGLCNIIEDSVCPVMIGINVGM